MTTERQMRLRGNGQRVTRYRASRDNTRVHLYVDVLGEHTLADLLALAGDQGAAPGDVTFRGGCFVLTVPATPEDVARWERADAESAEGARRSRRQAYERLRAEFEGAP